MRSKIPSKLILAICVWKYYILRPFRVVSVPLHTVVTQIGGSLYTIGRLFSPLSPLKAYSCVRFKARRLRLFLLSSTRIESVDDFSYELFFFGQCIVTLDDFQFYS